MKFYVNEPFRSGISTTAPARRHVEQLVTAHGLEFTDYEPFGPEDETFGGLALAICPARG